MQPPIGTPGAPWFALPRFAVAFRWPGGREDYLRAPDSGVATWSESDARALAERLNADPLGGKVYRAVRWRCA